MTPLPLLIAGALIAIFCLVRRLRSTAAFLAVSVTFALVRFFAAQLRAGAPVPYQNGTFWLWLFTEILPVSLPPVVALAIALRRPSPLLAASVVVALVGAIYPRLRGPDLLAAIWAYYVACYLVSAGILTARAALRGKMTRDEIALLALLLTGIASVAVVAIYGAAAWWAVQITYGVGLASAGVVATGFGAPPGGGARRA